MNLLKKIIMVIKRKKKIDPEIEKLLAPDEGPEILPETLGAEVKLQNEEPDTGIPVLSPPSESPIKKLVADDLLDELMKDELLSVGEEYGFLKLLEDASAEELVGELHEILTELRRLYNSGNRAG
ncbi:hypothetical protein [Methanosarcina sp. 1.H.A.2.2]|uniref:hypothetical protein n=1 Tax=Methanosarcina sp. 1.H.A.2.2 TaxID=1483601 RepID=UPI0006227917|nr:hypothetical protein [Methanosarcina sp. 1.H.A.2.2]KKH45836.1 hypothetical protein EO93_05265 [Methanosarcina sp. 1.H.A.2.2]